jgi:hypothetical protein
MTTIHTKTERAFIPHRFLLRGAQHFLGMAKERKCGWNHEWLGAIVLSALSIEAIGNCYGKRLIPDWETQIRDRVKQKLGASPWWKLQSVAARCGINSDFKNPPWSTAKKLTEFRDLIVHAKWEPLSKESDCAEGDWGLVSGERLEAEVEAMITEEFANQSCDAIEQIVTALNKNLTDSQLNALTYDGQEFQAQIT